jgi:hypothetical protein
MLSSMLSLSLSVALAGPQNFASPVPEQDWVEPDPVCSDVPEARGLVQPPALPQRTLRLPAEHCLATTTAELQAHVTSCRYDDIVLAPGRYTPDDLNGDFLSLTRPLRLWSQDSTWTVLEFGISLQTHFGSELHGLQIDLRDDTHAVRPSLNDPRTAAILFWDGPNGEGGGVVIEDTTLRGHGEVSFGILGTKATGVQIRRLGVEGFQRFGIRLDQDHPMTATALVQDVVVRDVGDPDWRAMPLCVPGQSSVSCYAPGTEEHGVWIGAATTLERVQVRDVWWAGVITGNCTNECTTDKSGALVCETVCDDPLTDVVFRDLDIDRIGVGDGLAGAGVGVAFERVTQDSEVDTFCIGPDTERGVHAEWNHGLAGESATDLTFTNGVISSTTAGVTLGSGTVGTVVDDVQVLNAWWAGVAMECCGSADPDTCDTTTIGAGVTAAAPATLACGFPGAGYVGACSCP